MDEAKLAIVFTYFSFGPGGLRAPCVLACAMRSLAIVITIVQSFLFLSFSPSPAFDPLLGISRVRKFVSPNIFAYLEDICNIFLKVNYIFLRKKSRFFSDFSTFYGQRSVTAAWATRSPLSIFSLFIFLSVFCF